MSKQIPLSRGYFAIVDDEDYEMLMAYKWHISHFGYAQTSVGGRENKRNILMHRLLMEVPKGMEIDHINGDRIDNRRCNLRLVTRSQNMHNMSGNTNTSSRFKGVSWDKDRNLWAVNIQTNGKSVHLGRYASEIEAARAYNIAAVQQHGEFARLNEIPEDIEDTVVYRPAKAFKHARTTHYRGVNFPKGKKRWVARIQVKGQGIHIGYFDTAEVAARAYDAAARKYYGDRAFLNFPDPS